MQAIVDRAVSCGVALEINSQAHRLDMNGRSRSGLAHERGARIVILERRSFTARLSIAAVGHRGRSTGVAGSARRAQHAGVYGVSGRLLPPKPARSMKLRLLSSDEKLAEIKRLHVPDDAADDSG